MEQRFKSSGRALWLRAGAVAIIDALLIFAIPQLVANESWILLVLLVLAGLLINYAYLNPRANASRWLTPGLILMAIFVVFPVFYTFYISTTNWRTGNTLTKEQVIDNLEGRLIQTDQTGPNLALAVYRNPAGELGFLVSGPDFEPFFGAPRPADAEPMADSALDLGGAAIDPAALPEAIGEYDLVQGLALTGLANQLQDLALDLPGGVFATVETLSSARVRSAGARFSYDPATDILTDNQASRTCTSGEGNFVCDGVPEPEVARTALQSADSQISCSGGVCDNVPLFAIDGSLPGWRTVIGPDNYLNIVTNERIRAPFLRVFSWNLVFAIGSVFLTFAMGLGLALALKDESMKGRALYRSIYIIPYAVPGFLSVLIWRGLLNTQFGKVNGALASFGIPAVDWLGSPVGAMVAVFLVNLWLGFPYMFLIASGALTSVPDDVLEAARVDGAGPWRTFRTVTLPLLLISTAPLLIGSFAFNFNNFILIFLLTRGGPPLGGFDVPVGATDLLISFTFNLAQGAGRGNQFGLATAVVVIIFVVLAVASATSFRLTKRLEDVYGK